MSDELAAMAELARRLVTSETPSTLSTLFSARGSTYRPVGSMMVSLPGLRAGGISGGCLEEYVARIGERATRNTYAVMLNFSTHPDADDAVPVLGCGGSLQVLVERLEPKHVAFLEQFAVAAQGDDGAFVACIVRGDLDSLTVTREWLRTGSTRQSIHDAMTSDTDVLLQCVPPVTRLVIFGAGDDAKPLCDIATTLGWHVAVADRRARLATKERFPGARAVVTGDWNEAVDALTFSPRTAVVLMTHSLDDDACVLSLLAGRPFAYLGALGPAHRCEWLLEQTSAFSFQRDDHIAATLRSPIGLDLGDRSAAGIAVAIVAEILAQLNHRDARPLDAIRNVAAVPVPRHYDAVA